MHAGVGGRRRNRAARAVAGVGALLAVASTGLATTGAAPTQAVAPPLVVDVGQVVRPIDRDLVGVHGRDDAERIATAFDDIAPTTFRHVMSDYDFLDFDCTTKTISPASIAYFTSWIDAVTARGARPILSLSYVPPCFARDGQPKGPPTDVAGYRAFLDDLFAALVTDRVKDGKEPMRWFELWNEPDIPIDPGNPSAGHGYVGTLDEYIAGNLPSLVGALQKAEADSGTDIHVGMPASFSPWSFGSVYGDLATMLEQANGYDRATAEALAAKADAAFGAGATERIMGNGGTTWGRRVIDEAAKLGLAIDFASVHLYPNNPLQGAQFPEQAAPRLLIGRNPDASPDDYRTLAERWRAEFPDQELVVSEWALSAGRDDRFGTCETASFDAASLSVMQDAGIDRALYLGHPSGVDDAPFRAWTDLPATQVSATVPDGLAGTWATAAHDADRTTLLVSAWHSKLTDAQDLSVPVVVDGLPDGTYDVTIDRIGEGTQAAADRTTLQATSTNGHLELPAVALRGQSLARIDVRAAGVDAPRAFTAATAAPATGTCLAKAAPGGGSSTTTTSPTGSPGATPATPVDGTATYTG
ncbi:MAG: hypothetical protein U0P45_13670 [Acidimicrobiales bacterium]